MNKLAAISVLAASLGLVRVSGECSSGWGKEPKYDDSSCKSYWYCEDYYGRVEHCPHGYQFHYEYKDCLKDEDVLCKWQLSSYHSSYSSSGSDSSWGSSHGKLPPLTAVCHLSTLFLFLNFSALFKAPV